MHPTVFSVILFLGKLHLRVEALAVMVINNSSFWKIIFSPFEGSRRFERKLQSIFNEPPGAKFHSIKILKIIIF
jgi:hypothetical protein